MWFFVCLHNWKWNVIVLDDLDWQLKVSYRFVNTSLASCFPRDASTITSLRDCRMWWPSVCTIWRSSAWRKLDAAYADKETTDCMMVYSRSHPISCRPLSPTRTTLLHIHATVCFMTRSSRMIASLHLRLLSQCRRCRQHHQVQLHCKTNSRTLRWMTMLITARDHRTHRYTDFRWTRSHRDS